MPCASCKGVSHNTKTCPFISVPLEGLAGCMNIFKEPKVIHASKGTTVCAACGEKGHNKRTCSAPVTLRVTKIKKVSKPLEGLAGCMNIFKEPKVIHASKGTTVCAQCGEKGHNKRTCVLQCQPYRIQDEDMATPVEIRVAASLSKLLD